MPIFGRKPGGVDTGYGEVFPSRMRAGLLGSYSRNAWLRNFGGRVGRNTSNSPTVSFGLYQRSNRARRGYSTTAVASSYMVDGHGGSEIVRPPVAPVQIHSGTEYEMAILATGSSASYGMGEWGYRQSERAGVTSFPVTYAPNWERPEGRMSLWLDLVDNRAPSVAATSPAHNSTIATPRPQLRARFSDPDASLGDKVRRFQFEVWTANANNQRVTRTHNSGSLNASAAVQGNNILGWDVPSNLAGGRYIARCMAWDLFDQPSAWREWVFTVNAGGAVEGFDLNANNYIEPGLVAEGVDILFQGRWQHQSGFNTASMTVTLYRGSGAHVSGPITRNRAVSPGALIGDYRSFFGFPALEPGNTYYVEMFVTDSGGSQSPVARTPVFRIQGPPDTPVLVAPENGAEFSEPPVLQLQAGDPHEIGEDVIIEYQFRRGTDAWGAWTSFDRTFWQDGFFWTALSESDLPNKDTWSWRARSKDLWGMESAPTGPRTFLYADPPSVSISSPVSGSTLETTTPLIEITTSSPTTKFWYTLTDTATSRPVYTRNPIVSTQPRLTWSTAVPSARLLNTRSYVLDVYAETAGGLRGHNSVSFTVDYPAPAALSSLRSERAQGPFEPASRPNEWSRIRLEWDAVPEGVAPSTEFWGYLVERRSLATGLVDLRTVIRSRTERVFVDPTPLSGVQYQYSVSWLRRVDARNYLVSATVTVQNGVTFSGTVLADLGDLTLGTVLYSYRDRRQDWGAPKSVEIYDTWGELPIAFQSLNRGDTISGTWVPVDSPTGQFMHSDLIAATKQMASVNVSDSGVPTPRALYYRDGRGRGMGCVIVDQSGENDRDWLNAGELRMTLREVRVTLVEEGP